jgi:hypothetical protein
MKSIPPDNWTGLSKLDNLARHQLKLRENNQNANVTLD